MITEAVLSCIPSIQAWLASDDNREHCRRACCRSTATSCCQTDTLYRPGGLLRLPADEPGWRQQDLCPCVLLELIPKDAFADQDGPAPMDTDGAAQDGPPRSPAPHASQVVQTERRVKEEGPPREEQERLEQAQELAVRPCWVVTHWQTVPRLVMRSTRHLHSRSAAGGSPHDECFWDSCSEQMRCCHCLPGTG